MEKHFKLSLEILVHVDSEGGYTTVLHKVDCGETYNDDGFPADIVAVAELIKASLPTNVITELKETE